MPARSRPTARFLTTTGWLGLVLVAALLLAGLLALVVFQTSLS